MTTFATLTKASAIAVCGLVFGMATAPLEAAQVLSLTSNVNGTSSLSIPEGTPTIQLILSLDTGGAPVSAMINHIEISPSNAAVTYAAPIGLVRLGSPSPWVSGELQYFPPDGTPLTYATVEEEAVGSSQWLKLTVIGEDEQPVQPQPDHPAFNAPIARYTFNTANLLPTTPGNEYVFTPYLDYFDNGVANFTPDIGTPGTFALTVTAVPEPSVIVGLIGIGVLGMMRARRTKA